MVPGSLRVPVASELVFPHGALFHSVDAVVDFDKPQDGDRQKRDDHGVRLWEIKVTDLDPDAGKFSPREVKVKVASEYQPVPPASQVPGYPAKVEFTDVQLVPWADGRKCTGKRVPHSCGARLGWSVWASGMIAFSADLASING